MATEDLTVRLRADDKLTPAVKKAAREAEQLDNKHVDVEVTADTKGATSAFAKFKSSIADADGVFGKFKAAGAGAFDAVKANAASLAVGAGAAIVAFGVKSAVAFQDLALQAGKLRDALGLTAEEASRWVEVTGDMGVGADTLQKSMGIMLRAAANAPATFSELGVAIAHAKDGTVDANQTFLNTIDRLNAIQDPAQRAAAAQKLLGRGWQDMAELIATGADGVKASLADVADAKIITDEQIAEGREMRAALDDLSDVIEEVSLKVGGKLAPAFSDSAAAVLEVVDVLGQLEAGYKKVTDAPIFSQIYKNLAPWEQWRTRIDQVKGAIDAISGGEDIDASISPELLAAWEQVPEPIDDTTDALKEAAEATKWVADAQEDLLGIAEKVAEAMQTEADALLAQVDAAMESADQQVQVNEAREKFNETLKDSKATADEVRDSAVDLAKEMVTLAETNMTAAGATTTATQKLDGQNGVLLDTAATARGPARRAILDYIGAVNQIPPEKVTEIQAAIDRGDIAEAQRLLDEASATRTATVNADAKTAGAEQILNQTARDRQANITAKVTVAPMPDWQRRLIQSGGAVPQSVPMAVGATATSTAAAPVSVVAPAAAIAPIVVPIQVSLAGIPTGAEIAHRIGRIRLPFSVSDGLRADERVAGSRL